VLKVLAGGAHPRLAADVCRVLGTEVAPAELAHYPDAEVVRIEVTLRRADVFIVQPMPPPPEGHIIELLLLADAASRAGAARVTAVIPFLGYSRQDRRAGGQRTALGARVIADVLSRGHIDEVVVVDLHQPAVEGFFSVPVEHLEAVSLLVERIRDISRPVIVAPDLGAARLADRVAGAIGAPFAVVHKTRTSGIEVTATRVTGDVQGHVPVIVDDMITTGGTVREAIHALQRAGCSAPAVVAVTHGIFAGGASDVLAALPIERLVVTDTVPVPPDIHSALEVVPVAPLLAEAISRLHTGRSLGPLRARR
jgi:ribose-phosphate pyrophosphokinase